MRREKAICLVSTPKIAHREATYAKKVSKPKKEKKSKSTPSPPEEPTPEEPLAEPLIKKKVLNASAKRN